jgi:acylglycerol lipase
MRLIAILALVLGLAGCSARLETAGEPIRAPALEDAQAIMADGAALPLRASLPDGEPKAVILGLHGFNDYSRALDLPGEFLAKQGIATYAYDQRGFGAAPEPGSWFGTKVMVEDARTVGRLLRAKYPHAKLFLLGESMGGAVALNTAIAAAPGEFDGIVLVAPATWGREALSWPQRGGLWFFSNTMAWLPLTGSGFRLVPTDNDAVLRELSADVKVRKQTTFGTLRGLVDLMDDAQQAARALPLPAFFAFGDRDEIVPSGPTCLLLSRLPARPPADWRVAFYPEGYHMLLRDLASAVVLRDIAAWVADRTAGLPSGLEVLKGDGAERERQLNELFFCRPHKSP